MCLSSRDLRHVFHSRVSHRWIGQPVSDQPTNQLESLKWVYLVKVPYPTPRAQGLVAAPHSLRVPSPERRDGQVPHETATAKKEIFHSTHENWSHGLRSAASELQSNEPRCFLPRVSQIFFFSPPDLTKKLQTSAKGGRRLLCRAARERVAMGGMRSSHPDTNSPFSLFPGQAGVASSPANGCGGSSWLGAHRAALCPSEQLRR